MKTSKIIIFSALMAVGCPKLIAQSFSQQNADGITIHYNVISNGNAEVTFPSAGSDSYSGQINVPAQISHSGVSYNVIRIGDNAFRGCRGISEISLPKGITHVGKWAFAGCDAITEIKLPQTLQEIDASAFDGCYALDYIDVESGNQSYRNIDGALYSADLKELVAMPPAREGEVDVAVSAEAISDRAFGGCTFIRSVKLPYGVTYIGNDAFYFCNWLEEIKVPPTVQNIGHGAFSDCINLKEIIVDQANDTYSSESGLLYDKAKTTLLQSPCASAMIPELPASLTTIGQQAFFRNYTLPTAVLPEGLETVGDAAFIDCPSLMSVLIPRTVNSIGAMAFAMCTSTRAIYACSATPAAISMGADVFEGVDKENCVLYVPEGSADQYSKAPQWKDFKNIQSSAMQTQEIMWDWQIDSTYSHKDYTQLSAKSTSQLPLTFSVSPQSDGMGYVDDLNRLIVTQPGKMYVTAYQHGNRTFLPAQPVTGIFYELTTSEPDITAPNVKVGSEDLRILISGADPESVATIHTPDGLLIYSGTDRVIPVLPNRVYIVRVEGTSHKIAVKR